MRGMIVAGVFAGLFAATSIADDAKPISVVNAAESCFLAIDDFGLAFERLQALGWNSATPSQIDTVARAVAELGNLGSLRAKPDAEAYDPSGLAGRIEQIKRDIPVTASRILDDFPGETFVDLSKQQAILTTRGDAQVMVMNMQSPLKVCAVLMSSDASAQNSTDAAIVGLEDLLQQRFPDHTQWFEAQGLEGPMLAIDFHGVQETGNTPFPSAHYYVLDPDRIAEHTEFEFWSGQVFAFFLQSL